MCDSNIAFKNAFKTYYKDSRIYGIMNATGGCKICGLGVQCQLVK